MYKKVDHDRQFSDMIDSYCCLLDIGPSTRDDIEVFIDLHCIDVPSDEAWFVPQGRYWLYGLDFELGALQTHHDPSACLLVYWHTI